MIIIDEAMEYEPLPERMIEAAAQAMDENYNPDRYPVLSAMFSDYARVALEAAAPFILAQTRKPRTITTKDELDALPMDAVIRDDDEYVWERWALLTKNTDWRCAGAPDLVDDDISLPAVVLWDPKA